MNALTQLERSLKATTQTQEFPSSYSGVIVTLKVPDDLAFELAVPGGEEEHELHITLAFLGSADDITPEDVLSWRNYFEALSRLAEKVPPLSLSVTGAGRFAGADDGKDACYLDVDGPGLGELRETVMRLAEACNLRPSRKHPTFHPHITLAYVPGDEAHPMPRPPHIPFTVPYLECWIGGTRAMWPFGVPAPAPLAKAEQGQSAGQGSLDAAREMYARLTGDLVQCHRQERRTRQRVEQLAQHHHAASEGLGAAITAPRGSALEDAFLDHAEEARIARTLGGHRG